MFLQRSKDPKLERLQHMTPGELAHIPGRSQDCRQRGESQTGVVLLTGTALLTNRNISIKRGISNHFNMSKFGLYRWQKIVTLISHGHPKRCMLLYLSDGFLHNRLLFLQWYNGTQLLNCHKRAFEYVRP